MIFFVKLYTFLQTLADLFIKLTKNFNLKVPIFAIFWGPSLGLNTKYQNFLWPCLFLCKSLTNLGGAAENLITWAQYAEWDLNKTSKTFTETLTALFLMA